MAQSISTISESPLVGSPTVMQVVPENYAENRTFHRSVLRVYAGLENGDFTDFDFSNPVETKIVNGSVITLPSEFNISSALKAVADRYEYSVNPPEKYPYIKFRVEAWDEYMIDGNTYKTGTQLWPGYYFPYYPNRSTIGYLYAYAFMGSFTDKERMNASIDPDTDAEYIIITNLSRKPSTPEIVFRNTPFVYPKAFNHGLERDENTEDPTTPHSGEPTDGPTSLIYNPTSLGPVTVGGHSLYVIPTPNDGHVLRYINGMGVEESVHVRSLEKREVPIVTDKYAISKQETLKKFSRSITKKSNDSEEWTLTSGPLDKDWVSWFVHEFLMSAVMWISIDSSWIPCHVLPEETTKMIDESDSNKLEIQFKIQLDINGSPT